MTFRLTAPCHFGLEKTLSFEVRRIGGEDIAVSDGRVTFTGDERVLIRANMCLSTAERVGILLSEFRARTFEELFQGIKAIPIEKYVGKFDRFPIKGFSLNSKLTSVPACQKIIKKAMVERMKSVYKIGYFQETEALFQFRFSIMKDNVTMTLDTSGEGLHKRGYRRFSNAAPIKETLAAGIADLARIRDNDIVCDPFCGSGTFPIEAAMMAANIAPGMNREFTAEQWENLIPKKEWYMAIEEANDNICMDIETDIQGFDLDENVIKIARQNAANAGVDKLIHFQARDVRQLSHAKKYGFVITNPPYGERLEEKEALPALYTALGQQFAKLDSWSAYVITSYTDIEKYFGRKADKNRKIYNGMLKTYFYSFLGPKPPKKNV